MSFRICFLDFDRSQEAIDFAPMCSSLIFLYEYIFDQKPVLNWINL